MKMSFKEWVGFGRDILLFRQETYSTHVAHKDVMQRGLAVLIVITLLAGLLPFLAGLIGDWASPGKPPAWIFSDQPPSIEELFGPAAEYIPLPPDLNDTIEEIFSPSTLLWVQMGFRIAELPTLMPKVLGTLFTNLASYISLPFQRLSAWMLYTLFVLLIGRLMGGKASAARMLGTTALYSIPHLLDLLSFVPCLGGLLGLVATLWGLGIYVKAVAVADEFSMGRAILVVILPALIVLLLGVIVSVLGVLLIAITGG